ncbi:trypsin-like peptidase domain-containing protein, partial [bacterium]|nr:trypsin-like peptidase domain-containing protein [bacterium]
EAIGLGSGFIVKKDGVIVTNYHVIENAYPALVKLKNGDVYEDISVIDCDGRKDIAALKIKGFDLPVVKLGNSNEVRVGEKVVVIGNPHGLENTISDGLLSQTRNTDFGYKLHQISAPISPGSSGSPVFNLKGEVIGIATLSDVLGQNLNFSVPINYVRGMLDAKPKMTLEEFSKIPREKAPTIQREDEKRAIELAKRSRGLLLEAPQIPELFFDDVEHYIRDQMRQKKPSVHIFGWQADKIDEQRYLVSYTYDDGSGERGWFFDVNVVGEIVSYRWPVQTRIKRLEWRIRHISERESAIRKLTTQGYKEDVARSKEALAAAYEVGLINAKDYQMDLTELQKGKAEKLKELKDEKDKLKKELKRLKKELEEQVREGKNTEKSNLSKLTKKEGDEINSWLQAANNFANAGMNDSAIEHYQKVIDKYPESGQAQEAQKRIKEIEAKESK